MKKIFYWRFSRKIEGEFWIFYKRFPWEKNWMEEIFKGISLKNWSWIHTRASLARAVFSFKTFFDCEWRSHLLSPTTSTSWNENERSECLWKWSEVIVKWKSEKKVKVKSIFGPLNLFNLRYIKEGVRGNDNIGIKKCTTIFLWVLNLGQVGEILENFQNHPLGESFWKIFSKVWFWKKL